MLSPGVRVARGATVRDSIVMFDAVIEEASATLDRAILDKECHVGARARASAAATTCARTATSRSACTRASRLVGKRARVPRGVEIGRNCRIDPGVTERDFSRRRRHPVGRDDRRRRRRAGERRGVDRRLARRARPRGRRLRPARRADPAFSRDVVVDGDRRFDLRVTVAWVAGVGCSLWAYYGPEAMEIPKRTYARMLHANFDYPFVKFALTDDDRPMLMTELPAAAVDRDELGRGITRLAIVADRLLEETAQRRGRPRDPARLERPRPAEPWAAGRLPGRGRGGHAGLGAAVARVRAAAG